MQIYNDSEASKYVSGTAVHWYIDNYVPANVLSFTHDMFPDKFLFGSEACNGDVPWEPRVKLGDWSRAEAYFNDIVTVNVQIYLFSL